MKEVSIDELTINIMDRMSSSLSAQQMDQLKSTLWMCMGKYKIYQEDCELSTEVDDNEYIIKMFLTTKRLEGCTDKTLAAYGFEYKMFLTKVDKNLRNVSTNDVRMYMAYLKANRHNSDVTINNKIRYLDSLFLWMTQEEYIDINPMVRIKQMKTEKKPKEIYTAEQLEVIRSNCLKEQDIAMRERDISIIELLDTSGIRISEMTGLNKDDLNLEENSCIVHGKGRKDRKVYFGGDAAYHIKKYIAERTDDNEALFITSKRPYKRLSDTAVRDMIKKCADAGGTIKQFRAHPHKFRRSMATNMLNRGANVGSVQHLLGHASSKTTLDCYYVATDREMEETYHKYIG